MQLAGGYTVEAIDHAAVLLEATVRAAAVVQVLHAGFWSTHLQTYAQVETEDSVESLLDLRLAGVFAVEQLFPVQGEDSIFAVVVDQKYEVALPNWAEEETVSVNYC